MADIADSVSTVADMNMWEEAAATTAGFLVPHILANVIESKAGFDLPNEVYGLAVVVGAQYSPMYGAEMSLGGGIYSVDAAAERVGLRSTVTELGGN